MLKVISGLMLIGTAGSIELDRISFMQAIMQISLAGAIFIIAEQAERIRNLKGKLYGK